MDSITKKNIRKKLARLKISELKSTNYYIINHLDSILKDKHFSNVFDCSICKKIFAELSIELPGAPAQTIDPEINKDDIIPCFGNLIQVLKEEVEIEKSKIESKYMPTQNDLTRWAIKESVLIYYQNLNMPPDLPVMVNRFDDRLKIELAPDFDVIARIWMEKLDELQRRDDKYGLTMEEFDKAEDDLMNGMRGSAFEKQLDRYREEFMQKLVR
jgi:hypothetical protein